VTQSTTSLPSLRLAELVAVVAEPAEILAERLGIERDEMGLIENALIHPSYTPEHGVPSNQRLEYLGDAVLDLVVAEALYVSHPEMDEGNMSKARISLVNETVLAELARALELGVMIKVGRGSKNAGDVEKPSVLADAMEAVFGAIYLSAGYDSVRNVIMNLLGDRFDAAAKNPGASDYKSLLNEWVDAEHNQPVVYELSVSGPDHDRHYVAQVRMGERVLGAGEGRSKKSAEIEAARAAWEVVQGA